MTVSEFINIENRNWDVEKLKQFFLLVDTNIISSLPISYKAGPDSWRWHFGNRGIFSVKSTYQVALSTTTSASSSSDSRIVAWWKQLWNLSIPPKVHIFIWRACCNILPVKTNLTQRQISSDASCPVCQTHDESGEHALLWCPTAYASWNHLVASNLSGFNPTVSVEEFLWLISQSCNHLTLCKICITLWAIWNNRNAHLFKLQTKQSHEISAWSQAFLEEYQAVFSNQNDQSRVPPRPANALWHPPIQGQLKLNTDAAVRLDFPQIGIGAVIKDHNGDIIVVVSRPYAGTFSPEIAELLAAREGLFLAKERCLQPQTLEVDASNVVSLLLSPSSGLDDSGMLVDDIRVLSSEINCSSVLAIPRSGNKLAHELASHALFSCFFQSRHSVPLCSLPV